MRPFVPLAAFTLSAILSACASAPPAPPPLPPTAYAEQAAAAPERIVTITPVALWHTPGGAHLDLLIAGPSAKTVADIAQFFQSSASSGPIEQTLGLRRPDGSTVDVRPIHPGGPPSPSGQLPAPVQVGGSRPACIATLTFRCSVKPGEKLILSLAPLGRICGGDPQFARPNDHATTVQDLADRPFRR